MPEGTLRAILKQAGVDADDFLEEQMKPGILSSTFHFPEMMLNLITSSVSDSLAILRQARDGVCPEYKVVSCRIRKAKKAHLRKVGEVTPNV